MMWLVAVVLRPLIFLIVLGLICLPVRLAVQRWLPEGKLKRLLLVQVGPKKTQRRA